jgi:protein-S-isoprenylcysteine O-methyltransferase Ste14
MDGQDHTGSEPVNARIFPLPPLVALLFIAAGWALNHYFPIGDSGASVPFENRIAGALIAGCAFGIAIFAVAEMRRARTAIRPGGKADALVSSGVYQRTRNPMYLSLALITIGVGIATANAWMVMMAPLLLLYFQERVIKREEAYLSARFGAEYDAYRSKVRRWF